MKREIFVFGSNLSGLHGAGSALHAYKYYGALGGCGNGYRNDSYAIPTKDHKVRTMELSDIKPYVEQFIDFAKHRPDLHFNIVAIGCGLAGYEPHEIAPMFDGAPPNCHFIDGWNLCSKK